MSTPTTERPSLHRNRPRTAAVRTSILALAMGACGPTLTLDPDSGSPASDGPGGSTGVADSGVMETTLPPTDPDSSDSGSPTTAGSVTTNDSSVFLPGHDFGNDINECDVFAQDCPRGEKCMPWANDGGATWNALRCTPVADDPGGPGDPCTVEGSGVSGIDDCELGAMCWNVNPETNTGSCVALCIGSPENPTCEAANASCSINGDGILALCLPWCDPLLQDCTEGHACYPIADEFRCAPVTDDAGGYASPCDSLNQCLPGLFCLDASVVPGCAGAGCCTEVCNITSELGDAQCMGVDGGQQCVPWFERPALPQYAEVGVCAIIE